MQLQRGSAIRVYLVGEETLSRESLGAMLNMDSALLVVGEADDVEHALLEIGTRKVDVVLLDMQLSSVDAIEAIRLLKEKHSGVPVVILTSISDGLVVRAVAAGASGCVLKTSTGQQLLRVVQAVHGGQTCIDPTLKDLLIQEMVESWRAHREGPVNLALTEREADVLRLLAWGYRNKEIANQLALSINTVKYHLENLYQKLGVQSRTQAVRVGGERHLLAV